MQQIEAVIDQFKLQEVRDALEDMGIDDFMESTIKCSGKQQALRFRGATFMATSIEKTRIDVIADDNAVAGIIEAIAAIARAGHKDDCRIAVHPCHEPT